MNLIELIKAAVYGVVEGITEWLPISSTGHMLLLNQFLSMDVSEDFWNMFLVVIQLGAILAVCVMFFHRLNPFSPSKSADERRGTWSLWGKTVVACIPAAVIGIPIDDWMEAHLMNAYVVSAMLILYGVLFIAVENINYGKRPAVERTGQISYQLALLIGLFQVLALVPGTSRSGATILGAMILGCSRSAAAEFSFFLGIPVMFGASLLKIVKFGLGFSGWEVFILLFGMAVAFLVSVYSIKFLMSYIRRNDFKMFGYYRIVLGAVVLLYFAVTAFAA